METLGERIKHIRKEKLGVNQEAFARMFGIESKSVVSMWENNTRKPEVDTAAKIASAGGVTVDWLINGDNGSDGIREPSLDFYPEKVSGRGARFPEYIVEAKVPAGDAEITDLSDWYQKDVLDYNPDDHRFLQIDHEFGYSMMPLVNPGDLALISLTAPVKNGDMVAAKWDETRGALKICTFIPNDPGRIVLTSYNPTIPPFSFRKNEVYMYKVVLLKKR